MTQYHFVSVWKYKAPVEKIWPIITDAEKWPTWWRGVRQVETLQKGDEDGVGTLQRFTWRSILPYNLVFDTQVLRVIKYKEIAGDSKGELAGMGVWDFSQEGPITQMRYTWDVATTEAWMNFLAPIARPFFMWNHDVIMRWGSEGLAKLLGTPVIQ